MQGNIHAKGVAPWVAPPMSGGGRPPHSSRLNILGRKNTHTTETGTAYRHIIESDTGESLGSLPTPLTSSRHIL